MKHVLFVRCWRCGTSVMLAALGGGFEKVGATDVDAVESALTRVVRVVVSIATRKTARVIEGVCVDCALDSRGLAEVPGQRPGAEVSAGSPPAPTQLTLENAYTPVEGSSNA